jgi:hypothetical protein
MNNKEKELGIQLTLELLHEIQKLMVNLQLTLPFDIIKVAQRVLYIHWWLLSHSLGRYWRLG